MDDPRAQSARVPGDMGLPYAKFVGSSASSALHPDGACESSARRATCVPRRPSLCSIGTTRKSDTRLPPSCRERLFAKRSSERSRKCPRQSFPEFVKLVKSGASKRYLQIPRNSDGDFIAAEVRDLGMGSPIGSPSCVALKTTRSFPGSEKPASAIERLSPLLGDRKGQRCAVAAAVATEVSGEVGRSVHDNLGGTGR
jgi:hypothetical protein